MSSLYRNNLSELKDYEEFFEVVCPEIMDNKKAYICIENCEYDKILSKIPLAENLLLPRNLKEMFSTTSKVKEKIIVDEFYKQFSFLKNRNRQYSDYFFYKLVAIYRYERFHKKLFILDNPFLQLDITEEQYMSDYLQQLSQHVKIIILSHRLQEVDKIADTIIYVEDKKIASIRENR